MAYTTTLQITQITGLGVQIENEIVGTGNSVLNSFDLKNGNVISNSYVLKYAAAGSNDFTSLIETTHYVLSKDGGSILLTSAGVTILAANILYADYVHSPKASDTVLESFIAAADEETEKRTSNYWGTDKTTVERTDGYTDGYPSTDEPFDTDYVEPFSYSLKNKGVTSITKIEILKVATVDREISSANIDFEENGNVHIHNETIPRGANNVKTTYVHGYDSVPPMISEMSALISGIMAYVKITGGSYDTPSTFSLGRASISVGQIYVNVREAINNFNNRLKVIENAMGSKMDVC